MHSVGQPSTLIDSGSVFSDLPHVPIYASWDDLIRRNTSIELVDTRLSTPYSSFLSPNSRAAPFSVLTSTMIPSTNIEASNLIPDDFPMFWPSEDPFASAITGNQLLGSYPDATELNSWLELNLDLEADLTTTTPAQICADVILGKPVLSPWHDKFISGAETSEDIDFLVRSYGMAIQRTDKQLRKFMLNLGCQFWLAKIYAYKLGREEDALRLWESVEKGYGSVLARNSDGQMEVLRILNFEELSRRKKIEQMTATIDQSVAHDDLYHATQKLIIIGKAMELRNAPEWHVRQVYVKVIRRCLSWEIHRQFLGHYRPLLILLRCLGNALMAIKEYEDAQCALDLTASVEWSFLGGIMPLNDSFCDNCIVDSRPTVLELIQGFCFTCTVCFSIDLCGTCFTAREQGLAFESIRRCSRDHKYLKIPGPNWNPEESTAASNGIKTSNLRRWLDGLCAKYLDGQSLVL